MALMLVLFCAAVLTAALSAPTKAAKSFFTEEISGTYVPVSSESAYAGSTCPTAVAWETYAYWTGMCMSPMIRRTGKWTPHKQIKIRG